MADIDVQMLEMAPKLLNEYKDEDMTKMADLMLDLAKVGHFITTGQKFERTH